MAEDGTLFNERLMTAEAGEAFAAFARQRSCLAAPCISEFPNFA